MAILYSLPTQIAAQKHPDLDHKDYGELYAHDQHQLFGHSSGSKKENPRTTV